MRFCPRAAAPLAFAATLCSSAAAFASAAGGHAAIPLDQILWELGIKVLDVAIIAYFGFKFLSKPIAKAMANRADAVRRSLDEATAGRREAEARLREFQEKAARLESEIQELTNRTAVDIERELALLQEEAKAAAERVRQHARETIRQELTKARADLHREAADLAVQLATESVKAQMTAEEQRRLTGDYLKEMEAAR
jgi:F-type H+-transporting ATPase subunit b